MLSEVSVHCQSLKERVMYPFLTGREQLCQKEALPVKTEL